MAGRVAVIVFLSLGLAIAISHASSEECDTFEEENKKGEREVEENKVDTVYDITSRSSRKSVTLYVKPGQDFQGVSLEVTQVQNPTHVVWFPVDQLYTGTKWVELKMIVRTEGNKKPHHDLYFELKSGDCEKVCKKSSNHYYNMRLRVVAHGSSTWRCEKPRNMNIEDRSRKLPFTTDTTQCKNPPGHNQSDITDPTLKPTTGTTTSPITSTHRGETTPSTASPTAAPTSNLIIIVPVVVVVVVAVVIVAVVVYCRMRQRRSVTSVSETSHPRQPDPATPTRASVHVIENSLYEPFSGPQTRPAARGHQEQVHVIENSLYEPFSGPKTQ
ncbi:uncharacterized protein LOC127001242 isoform X1 [Eriocheir sinensis]|uniref:uncharacterized protein LOC127001242 isoform X1 n=1 Tax=Eriocheir sinensis TaxID=95602 RepID=UPI0021CABAF0|nr:uncharacterized protein LOC127001242 isoform X1 [Eriocheir sinensis]